MNRTGLLTLLVSVACETAAPTDATPIDAGTPDVPLVPGEGDACQLSLGCGAGQICVDDACLLASRVIWEDLEFGEVRYVDWWGEELDLDPMEGGFIGVGYAGDEDQGFAWASPTEIGYVSETRAGRFAYTLPNPVVQVVLAPTGVLAVERVDMWARALLHFDWDGNLVNRVPMPDPGYAHSALLPTETGAILVFLRCAELVTTYETTSFGPFDGPTEVPWPSDEVVGCGDGYAFLRDSRGTWLATPNALTNLRSGERVVFDSLWPAGEFHDGGLVGVQWAPQRSLLVLFPDIPSMPGETESTVVTFYEEGERYGVDFGDNAFAYFVNHATFRFVARAQVDPYPDRLVASDGRVVTELPDQSCMDYSYSRHGLTLEGFCASGGEERALHRRH